MAKAYCIDTISPASPVAGASISWNAWLAAGIILFRRTLLRMIDTLALWRERARQRQVLLTLDDRLLSDIGVTRAEAEVEAARPFWHG